MGYNTIGIVLSDEVSDLPAMQAAMALAAREDAHLDVFCLGIDPVRYDMAPLGAAPSLVMALHSDAKEHATRLSNWAKTQLRQTQIRSAVQSLVVTTLSLDQSIAQIVRYCDLIVASQPYGPAAAPLQVTILEAALFGTGAPVLVVPRADRDYHQSFGRILVAWNESAESLEVIRKAMPSLEAADHAHIVMVDPPSHSPERSDPGGALCIMLARHGIKAEVSILSKTMPRVSEVLNRHAQEHATDLIVMGAYGHSRFRQSLLGGATRDMLESAQVPVMMAH